MSWVLIVTTVFASGFRSYEHLGAYNTKATCEERAVMVRASLSDNRREVACEVRQGR